MSIETLPSPLSILIYLDAVQCNILVHLVPCTIFYNPFDRTLNPHKSDISLPRRASFLAVVSPP